MNIQEFTGINTRDALRKVKGVLGEDALILSSRKTPEGVEIVATQGNAEEEISDVSYAHAVYGESGSTTQSETGPQPNVQVQAAPAKPEATVVRKPVSKMPEVSSEDVEDKTAVNSTQLEQKEKSHTPEVQGYEVEDVDLGEWQRKLMSELKEMRSIIEPEHNKSKRSRQDNKARLRSRMVKAGFTPALASDLARSLPDGLNNLNWQPDLMDEWLMRQFDSWLPSGLNVDKLLDCGGTFALVGPTGSGKTTTTAKIAARYVMEHGASGLALVSTDHYRVGAHEQLKEYASLLKVDFGAVRPGQSLEDVLGRFSDKQVVLVDTVGFSQRDIRVVEQIARLQESANDIHLVLLLNAASHDQTLEEVVTCYRQAASTAGIRVEHCIMTKLDESPSPVPAVDRIMRHGLCTLFTTAGQRVPEDLEPADLRKIIGPVVKEYLQQPCAVTVPEESDETNHDWTRDLIFRGRQVQVLQRKISQSVPGFEHVESLWAISLLYPSWQQSLLNERLRQNIPSPLSHRGVFRTSHKPMHGCDFPCPDLLMEPGHLPVGLSLLHRHQEEAEQHLGSPVFTGPNLFQNFPGLPTLHRLSEHSVPWMSASGPGTSLWVNDSYTTVSELVEKGEPVVVAEMPFLDKTVEMRLYCQRVRAAEGEMARFSMDCTLWYADLYDKESGEPLAERYWLSSGEEFGDTYVRFFMVSEHLPVLVRQVTSVLDTIPGFRSCDELKQLVSASVASIAMNIELTNLPEMEDIRIGLIQLLGDSSGYNLRNITDALCHLFIARELVESQWVS